MCKHCEKIKEDIQHKETVHKFMQAAADGINRRIREDGNETPQLITPDDIDIELKVTASVRPIAARFQEMHPAVLKLIYRDLLDAVK